MRKIERCETPKCKFNDGVGCDELARGRDYACDDCGWNPAEHERRLEKLEKTEETEGDESDA